MSDVMFTHVRNNLYGLGEAWCLQNVREEEEDSSLIMTVIVLKLIRMYEYDVSCCAKIL